MLSELVSTILSITYYIISKANGAEGDEGKVEAFSITPALHITEDHWWENQKNQCSYCQKKSRCQSLHHLWIRKEDNGMDVNYSRGLRASGNLNNVCLVCYCSKCMLLKTYSTWQCSMWIIHGLEEEPRTDLSLRLQAYRNFSIRTQCWGFFILWSIFFPIRPENGGRGSRYFKRDRARYTVTWGEWSLVRMRKLLLIWPSLKDKPALWHRLFSPKCISITLGSGSESKNRWIRGSSWPQNMPFLAALLVLAMLPSLSDILVNQAKVEAQTWEHSLKITRKQRQ